MNYNHQNNYVYKYLLINSHDRKYGNNSKFNIELPFGIPIRCVELLNVQIPNTFYNITEDNNKLIYDAELRSMTPGCYNWTEFKAQFLIDFVNEFSDIQYNDITQQIILTGVNPPRNLRFPQNGGSINRVLGFDLSYNVTAATYVSNSPPNLNSNYIYIEISELGNNQMTSSSLYYGQLFTIPNNQDKQEYIEFNNNTNYPQIISCFENKQYIYNLTVSLKNDYGHELINVGNWSMLLKVCY